MKNSIEDINKAWVGAYAGKPIRDLIREGDITDEEKEVLNRLADKKEDKAMQEYDEKEGQTNKTETEVPVIEKREEEKTQENIDKMVKFIENSPDVKFMVGARGNILGEGNLVGFRVGFYDINEKKIKEPKGDIDVWLDISFKMSDYDNFPDGHSAYNRLYTHDGFVVFAKGTLFHANENDRSFSRESRRQAFVTAIVYKKEFLNSLKNLEIKEMLEHPYTEIFDEVFDTYARKCVPGFYNYMLSRLPKLNK